jgi:hypothetical protein
LCDRTEDRPRSWPSKQTLPAKHKPTRRVWSPCLMTSLLVRGRYKLIERSPCLKSTLLQCNGGPCAEAERGSGKVCLTPALIWAATDSDRVMVLCVAHSGRNGNGKRRQQQRSSSTSIDAQDQTQTHRVSMRKGPLCLLDAQEVAI